MCKNSIRILSLIISAFIISLSLASCGGSDEKSTSAVNSESYSVLATSATQSTTATEKVTESTVNSDSDNDTKTTKRNNTAATTTKKASSQNSGVKSAYNNYLSTFSAVPSSKTISKPKADIKKGLQILVNNDHKYDDTQSQNLVNMIDISNRSFLLSYTDLTVDEFTLQQFNYMNADYYSKYSEKATVCSAYRSVASQKRNFDKSVASVGEKETLKWFTRPGYSEHHTGFAIDYNTNSFGDEAFTGKGNEAWMSQNCFKYGIILRYQASKKSITGVNAEAWHFRQVGIPHADYISKNNLCLEEYTAKVKSFPYESPLTVNADGGGTYYIWYVKSAGNATDINLSGYSKYTCSGNNEDGFIITAIK